jgi:hypothetical protein
MKTKISHVKLDNNREVRVVEEGREGSTVFVRPLGEQEVDTGKIVEFDPEQEQLIVTTPVYCVTLHTTEEVGRQDDILTWVRVVPDGRDGSKVYGRTLLPDEPDTGLAPQLRPGDNFVLQAGSLVFSVDSVDASAATKFKDGYASIANTVWTWLSLYPTFSCKVLPEEVSRFLLSAARRLDASYEAFSLLHNKLKELETVEYGIRQRNLIFEIMGLVEIAIVAMNRALQMALQIHEHYSVNVHFPDSVRDKLRALKEMRNAYEHIEDRALGFVRGQPHIDALSIFNYERLFEEGIATYGNYELDIYNETTQLLIETRQYLKETTSELASNLSL